MNTTQKIGSFVIVGLVIIIGVLFGMGVIKMPESPDVVFQKFAQAQSTITSSTNSLTVTADVTVPGTATASSQPAAPTTTHVVATLDGSASKVGGAPAEDFHFTVTGSPDASSNVSVEGNFRLVDKVIYLEATQLPPLPIDTTALLNKWISLDPLALAQQAGDTSGASSLENFLGPKAAMPAQFSIDAMNLAKSDGLIKGITPSGNETVSGVATHAYTITIDTTKLADFIPAYVTLLNSYLVKAGQTPIPVTPLTDEDKATLAELTIPNIKIWIGAKDYLLYRIAGTVAFDGVGAATLGNSGASGTITLDETVKAYNTNPVITAPAGAVPFQQFLTSVLGGTSM